MVTMKILMALATELQHGCLHIACLQAHMFNAGYEGLVLCTRSSLGQVMCDCPMSVGVDLKIVGNADDD